MERTIKIQLLVKKLHIKQEDLKSRMQEILKYNTAPFDSEFLNQLSDVLKQLLDNQSHLHHLVTLLSDLNATENSVDSTFKKSTSHKRSIVKRLLDFFEELDCLKHKNGQTFRKPFENGKRKD